MSSCILKLLRYTALILVLLFSSREAISQHNTDTNHVAQFALDTAAHWAWYLKGNSVYKLSAYEIKKADSILSTCISENNNNGKPSSTFGIFIGIHNFKKQFVASRNKNGEIVVWANCLCDDFFNEKPTGKKSKDNKGPYFSDGNSKWKHNIITVHDGGGDGCFFHVILNLTTGKYSQLYVNGL